MYLQFGAGIIANSSNQTAFTIQQLKPMKNLRQTTLLFLMAGALAVNGAKGNDFSGFLENRPSSQSLGGATENRSDNEFLPVDEAFSVVLRAEPGGGYVLEWTIAPEYYLYRRMFKVEQQDGRDITAQSHFSRGLHKKDGYFGQVEVFYHSASAQLGQDTIGNNGENSGKMSEGTLTVSYQGCAESGLCYPTQTRVLLIP